MSDWPIGLSTGCFFRRRIFDVLEAIRDAGIKDIEVCSFPLHLDYHNEAEAKRAGKAMRDLEIRPYSFHAPFAERIDITAFDASVRDAAVEELFRACRAAALVGAEHVVLHPGPEREGRPPDHEFRRHVEYAAESLNRVAAHCCELGVKLLLENMLPHLLFGHTRDMLYLVGCIQACSVGVCLDTGHAFLAGELSNVINKLSGHLRMVHVNDNRGDWDAHLSPGEGRIDWKEVMRELRRSDFRGGLILELAGADNEPIDHILDRARRARRFLIEIIGGLESVGVRARADIESPGPGAANEASRPA